MTVLIWILGIAAALFLLTFTFGWPVWALAAARVTIVLAWLAVTAGVLIFNSGGINPNGG